MKPLFERIPFYFVLAFLASCSTSNELVFEMIELDVGFSPSMSSATGDLDNDGKGVFSKGDQEFPPLHLTDPIGVEFS